MMMAISDVERISRHASIPPIPGMFMSNSTRSYVPDLSSPSAFFAGARIGDLVSARGQSCSHSPTDLGIIVNHQNPAGAHSAPRRERQGKRELGAFPGFAANPDLLAMRTDNLARNGQTHSGTFEVSLFCAAIKFIENSRLFFFRDSRTPIRHVNDDKIAAHLRADRNRCASGRIFQCIIDQVSD